MGDADVVLRGAAFQTYGAFCVDHGHAGELPKFNALKQALCSAPVLRTFDLASRALLTTDASIIAVAAILSLDS
jgi:hypothetical protein